MMKAMNGKLTTKGLVLCECCNNNTTEKVLHTVGYDKLLTMCDGCEAIIQVDEILAVEHRLRMNLNRSGFTAAEIMWLGSDDIFSIQLPLKKGWLTVCYDNKMIPSYSFHLVEQDESGYNEDTRQFFETEQQLIEYVNRKYAKAKNLSW